MSPRHYYHFGLGNCLKNALENRTVDVDDLKFLVGIDGIPTAKSNRSEFWSILGQLKEVGLEQTFVIGLYSGPSKPSCVNEFF